MDEVVRIFNASSININLHSSVRPGALVDDGNFVNPRTFELAACGAFQLVDRRSLMDGLFGPDELVLFEDMDGLLAAIEHYRFRPELRAEAAARSRARVLAEHTYTQEAQDFVSRRPSMPLPPGGFWG